VDKIHKLGVLLWQYKERIVLLVVVGVLCYRVYTAINPPEPPAPTPHRLPEVVENDAEILPPAPGVPPRTLIPVDRKELAKRNPFWYHAGGGGNTTDAPPKVDLELRRIQSAPGGGHRAGIRANGRTGYYGEGDVIDGQYELVSIDPENETVTVRADQFEEPIVLRRER